jgi:hypothetical protein
LIILGESDRIGHFPQFLSEREYVEAELVKAADFESDRIGHFPQYRETPARGSTVRAGAHVQDRGETAQEAMTMNERDRGCDTRDGEGRPQAPRRYQVFIRKQQMHCDC